MVNNMIMYEISSYIIRWNDRLLIYRDATLSSKTNGYDK